MPISIPFPFLEAVARVSRALAASGAKFAMFMGEPGVVDKEDIEDAHHRAAPSTL